MSRRELVSAVGIAVAGAAISYLADTLTQWVMHQVQTMRLSVGPGPHWASIDWTDDRRLYTAIMLLPAMALLNAALRADRPMRFIELVLPGAGFIAGAGVIPAALSTYLNRNGTLIALSKEWYWFMGITGATTLAGVWAMRRFGVAGLGAALLASLIAATVYFGFQTRGYLGIGRALPRDPLSFAAIVVGNTGRTWGAWLLPLAALNLRHRSARGEARRPNPRDSAVGANT